MTKKFYKLTVAALLAAFVALAIVPSNLVAQTVRGVKNYIEGCSGTRPCDNIYHFGGSVDVDSGGEIDFESGSALKIAGTAVTATAAELNALASAGVSAAEAAVLGAVTASAAEINALTGAGVSAAEAAVLGAVTASAAEINALTGAGISNAEATQLGAITLTGAQVNTAVLGVAAGYKVARAETALDGSNPTSVASGLTTIIACTVTLKGTAAPGLGTSVLTGNINSTNFDVYAWKPTGAGDTTLIASTGPESFYTVCVGT